MLVLERLPLEDLSHALEEARNDKELVPYSHYAVKVKTLLQALRFVPFAIGHDAWSSARLWLAQFSLRSLFGAGAICGGHGPCMERGGGAPKGRNQCVFLDTSSLREVTF